MAQNLQSKSELFQLIATDFSDIDDLSRLIEAQNLQARPELEKEFIAPRTPVEEKLAELCSKLLSVERVGVNDSFFEIGGHSLLATQLLSRVYDAFKVDLPLHTLFEGPTVGELAQKIESAINSNRPAITPVTRIERAADAIPLSFAQQRLWILNQLEPDSSAYNIPAAVRLIGRLEEELFSESLEEVINRHESLRTTFAVVEGQPRQTISDKASLSLEQVNLSHLCEEERLRELESIIRREAEAGFDLSGGPLMRATLIKIEEQEHVAVLVMHHIISDGWSMGVLIDEVTRAYEGLIEGRSSGLKELEIQYADYAEWQRGWLSGEVLEEQIRYWREQLSGAPALLELPTDRPRPPIQSHRGAELHFSISPELSTALTALGQQHQATLFMTLLAAFKLLLARYTHQPDIVVGTPIAGRNRTELEPLIGFFVNTLALRTDLGGEPTFVELLRRVKEVCLGAYAHQELPFEKLVEELQPERELSRTPLFQVMFAMQTKAQQLVQVPGLQLSGIEVTNHAAQFDLTLSLVETPEQLTGKLEYSTDLFEPSTMSRLLDHFTVLLEAIAANPERSIYALPLVGAVERRQLLDEWNATGREYPSQPACLHELFEAQVERTPDAVALVYDNQQLTYLELNQKANQLAHYLRELGVGPEALVGVLMERSVEMVVSLYAILKAGGAYLPLDPQYPSERLAFMLENAGARALLTKESLRERVAECRTKVVCVDLKREQIAERSAENICDSEVAGANLAYVIYTSGSTGTPKAAMNSHGAIRNRLLWMQDAYQLTGADCVLQKTPYSFDVSVWEFFWPLITGARLVVARPGGHQDAAYLVELIKQQEVTTLHFVPSMLRLFIEEPGVESCQSLKRVICSGEALGYELQERFFARHATASLENLYGPTEAAVDVTYWTCPRDGSERTVPIGRPIANTQIYVLDERLEPVPVGVAGELHIGGVGVGRGYLRHPALTAEKFIPHPFGQREGACLYRTGDLARFRADGVIEYLGRKDFQVKVRGFRIELGEVEAAMEGHAGVREALVVIREESVSDKRLVAYVIPSNASQPPALGELRAYMKEKLPEYMVPTAFVMLDAFPLTPNGKLDRRALPAPGVDRPELEKEYVEPRTPVEISLAEMCAGLLGIERVGLHDNFFELGGHSLLAIQLVSKARDTFGIDLPPHLLFEGPTVWELAQKIESAINSNGPAITPVTRIERAADAIPLSFAQQRLWILNQLEPDSSAYNIPAAVRLIGRLEEELFSESLEEVINRHESLRTTFEVIGAEPVQVIAEAGSLELKRVDLSHLCEEERLRELESIIRREAEAGFDLSRGPLMRATLIKIEEQEHVAVLVMHHIISDGWSMGLLIDELGKVYEAGCEGRTPNLEELEIQYADYAEWQRRWLSGEVLEEQIRYWREQLSGAPALLELPTDRPRPPVQTSAGAVRSFELSVSLTEQLRAFNRREGVTLFMVLLAAFKLLLHHYTGQEDIVVGSPTANRNRTELAGLIGFFVNTLVLRTDLSGNPSFREVLGRVREMLSAAQAYQELPFDKLVEELRPTRDLSYSPLFQVMFTFQKALAESLSLPDLTLEPLELHNGTAKRDLTLTIVDREQDELSASFEYNTDLLDSATVDRLVGHFRRVLESVVANPDCRVSELSLLTDAESSGLLVQWNDTAAAYSKQQTILDLFEAQVKQTPEDVAVAYEGETLTYRELNRRANKIAHRLERSGVGPETLVGICVTRSLEMIVAVMGVLKAGAAYVPLDPAYPKERLAYMLDDARVRVLITQEQIASWLPKHEAEVICLDTAAPEFELESEENPASSASPENLAYVIYTSGSTGRPKGVTVEHRQLLNYTKGIIERLGIEPGASFAMVQPLTVDSCITVIYPALVTGGRLHVISQERAADSEALAAYFTEHSIDCLKIAPSHLAALQQVSTRAEELLPRRQLVIGGEASHWELMETLQPLAGDCAIFNHYGPTETTVGVLTCRVEKQTDAHYSPTVPMGRPVPNAQVYLLNRYSQPVPVGVAGELFIGGDCLARGYLGWPELTAEKFVPDPFSKVPGARLYRTGDVASYLPDGKLVFLGRADDQVKIRGFRIELGEIEATIKEHAAVREALVITTREAGDNRLVAYVAPERAVPAPSVGELRAHLKSHLPEFMVPSVFIFLEQLPRTGHGKVDRRMLPAPDSVRPVSEENYVAPLTKAEQTIATLWQEALGLEKVGTQDNFFDLGGHSLLLIKVHNRLQQKFNRKFPILEMFRHSTVAQLAAYLSTEEEQTNQPSLQESQERGRQQKEAIRRRQQLRRLDQVTR